jgi:3',5'-cyclic AMP phosphodiesterase CpdA
MSRAVAAVTTVAAALLLAPSASAAPFTTVQRTIQDCDGDNLLDFTFGEEHVFFLAFPSDDHDPCSFEASHGEDLRLPPSASIVNFLQLSDFQVVDEESPARVEWLDATQRIPRLQPFSAAYRPQESLTTQVTEAMVRQARNAVSPITAAPLDLTILTGDNADSQQYNETRWFIDILDGTDQTSEPNPDPEMEDPTLVRPDGTVTAPTAPRDRKVDPNSGIPGPDPNVDLPNPPTCEATPGSVYDGVRNSGDRATAPDFGYYEPDSSTGDRQDGDGYTPDREDNARETPGRDVTVRDFRGLFEAANEPFEAIGLDMPWYSAFGNHDALVQGNSPEAFIGPVGPGPAPGEASEDYDEAYHRIATGCVKVMQPATGVRGQIEDLVEEIEELREGGVTPDEQPSIDELTGQVLAAAADVLLHPCDPNRDEGCVVEIVPPDPRRCFLPKDERNTTAAGSPCQTGSWIRQHFRTTGTPVGHGFAASPTLPDEKQGSFCQQNPTDEDCVQAGYGRPPEAARNNDGYYSFSPTPGLRFVVLDTVTDECGSEFCSEGSVDDTQFHWMRQQILTAEELREYVVLFSHHTLRTTRFVSTDLTEHPLHYGQRFDRRSPGNPQNQGGGETLEELYCGHPAVLAHVAGHEHENYVARHDCSDDEPPPPKCAPPAPVGTCPNPHFWHISTAAHIDWPQQARMIELVKLGENMSFVLTMLDHDGPANPGGLPPGHEDHGHAPDDVLRLAGIGREIAYNDYQADRGARGAREDRNVILPTDRPPPPAFQP